jgi:hypothetical protein
MRSDRRVDRKHVDHRGILGTRSNVTYLPRGIAQPTELHQILNALRPSIPSAIVNWPYTIGEDWSGDPAIFFWLTLL